MKKVLSIIAVVALTCAVFSCSSKPVDDAMGKKIVEKIIETGKAQNIKCLDALTNEDLAKTVSKEEGGSIRGYSEWLQSESGQSILQEVMVKCMSE